jgi:two-component sensor histidine kinase
MWASMATAEADICGKALPADLAAIFDQSPRPMLVMANDPPRYTMVACNEAHARAFRTTPQTLVGRGLFEVFGDAPPPEVAAFMTAVRDSFHRALETGGDDEMAIQRYAIPGPDGLPQERWWSATHTPVKDRRGRVTHILSCIRDATGEVNERRTNEARALLMREVDHRARNALTVVLSLLRLTGGEDLGHYRDSVMGRVEALARAQGSLTRGKWEGAHLADVVQAELAAIVRPGRYTASGPPVTLAAQDVQAMSMILHELATNAAKYGALSAEDGRVEIAWRTEPGGGLRLTWREHDGPPPPQALATTGFGSRLITELSRQLGGEATREWTPTGLAFELAWTPTPHDDDRSAEDEALAALQLVGN